MTTRHQIACISKARGASLYEQIESVGGVTGTSHRGLAVTHSIKALKVGKWNFMSVIQER